MSFFYKKPEYSYDGDQWDPIAAGVLIPDGRVKLGVSGIIKRITGYSQTQQGP